MAIFDLFLYRATAEHYLMYPTQNIIRYCTVKLKYSVSSSSDAIKGTRDE